MKTRKEIKDEYKQMKFRIGVFQIRNTVNNKIFVEGSTDLVAIWNRIKFQLNAGLHPNAELQKEWKEFGAENFVYEILGEIKQDDTESVDYRREVKQLEEMYLEKMQPYGNKGYNVIRKTK
ncbi:MAG: GIY-YIG nuclease family protein [Bacteroidales bacterium]|nr:GIY-YIG nuclease family protein [Bacteroidales bacterium]